MFLKRSRLFFECHLILVVKEQFKFRLAIVRSYDGHRVNRQRMGKTSLNSRKIALLKQVNKTTRPQDFLILNRLQTRKRQLSITLGWRYYYV